MESPFHQPLENLKSTLSKILPMPVGSNPSVDYSRRNWWMPQGPMLSIPSWVPGQQASAQTGGSPTASDPLNETNQSAEVPAEESRAVEADSGGENAAMQELSKPIKRRPRSQKGANLPLSVRIAYRELRAELWGHMGSEHDEETKAMFQAKRKKWIQQFRGDAPDWKGATKANQDARAAERFSGRLVHLIMMPCLCSGGFVIYLAMAYGLFPLTAE
jgi:hypothetical protein